MRQTLGYDMTFQSTLPRRERRLVAAVVLNRVISIHAPAKGATLLSVYQPPRNHYFNPRSREGSDRWGRRIFLMAFKFQSTLPRRERRNFYIVGADSVHFNPRSREGSDDVGLKGCLES